MENMCGLRLTQMEEAAEDLITRHGVAEAAAADIRALLAAELPMFGASHVARIKEMWGITAAYSLPLLPQVAASADGGVPLVVSEPGSDAAAVYAALAAGVHAEVSALGEQKIPSVMYMAEQGKVLIAIPDGRMQEISPADLRANCRSPANDLANLPDDLHPLSMVPMGNYAISVQWSDGHQSLIPYRFFISGYPYESQPRP